MLVFAFSLALMLLFACPLHSTTVSATPQYLSGLLSPILIQFLVDNLTIVITHTRTHNYASP